MKKIKNLLLVVLIFSFAVTPMTSLAKNTNPYCIVGYDTGAGCQVTKFYKYGDDNIAREDFNRRLLYYDNRLVLGTQGKIVLSSKHTGVPSWTAKGGNAIWLETDKTAWAYNYSSKQKSQICEKVESLNLTARSIAESLTLQDGSVKKISELTNGSSGDSSGGSDDSSGGDDSSSSGSDDSDDSSAEDERETLDISTDAAGQTHYAFGDYSLTVNENRIYLYGNEMSYRISDYCDSNVQFVGIDETTYDVYLYEDETNEYYKFEMDNPLKPSKLRFIKGTEFEGVETDETYHWLTAIVTTTGTFTLDQLVVDRKWYPKLDYVINKYSYAIYYKKQQDLEYRLEYKNGKLYFDGKKIAKNLARKTETFGFKKIKKNNYIYYITKSSKGPKVYRAKIDKPKKAEFVQYGTKFGYDTKTGFINKIYKP